MASRQQLQSVKCETIPTGSVEKKMSILFYYFKADTSELIKIKQIGRTPSKFAILAKKINTQGNLNSGLTNVIEWT